MEQVALENILTTVKKNLDETYKKVEEKIKNFKESTIKHPRVFEFFNRVMFYYLYDGDGDSPEACIKTSLYTMMHYVISTFDETHNFILSLISFLSNTCMDDSYFKIQWKVYRFVGVEIEHRIFDHQVKGSYPIILFADGVEKDSSCDIELLHGALDILVQRESIRHNCVKNY